MASGYLENASQLTPTSDCQGSNNWGSGILLSSPKNLSLPTGLVHWSHLELILLDSGDNSQTDHTCQIFLSWDAAGDDICAGPSGVATMVAGRTDVDTYMNVYDLDMKPTLPPDGEADKVYLWFNTVAFTDTTPPVIRARLHWNEILRG